MPHLFLAKLYYYIPHLEKVTRDVKLMEIRPAPHNSFFQATIFHQCSSPIVYIRKACNLGGYLATLSFWLEVFCSGSEKTALSLDTFLNLYSQYPSTVTNISHGIIHIIPETEALLVLFIALKGL